MLTSCETMPFFARLKKFWYQLGSPVYFYDFAARHTPWIATLSVTLYGIGLCWGLGFAPADYQQGNSFRIIYIHVPAAFFSMGVYVAMAVCCAVGLIWRIKVSFMMAQSLAVIGACFTLIALFSGAVWGKPTWGTWWVWDARLTSELILFFLYLGFISLNQALPEKDTADKASGILAITGVVNIPIIHYSVVWWHSLHQGSSILKFARPSIDPSMLWPLLIMILAFALLALAYVLIDTRTQILQQRVARLSV